MPFSVVKRTRTRQPQILVALDHGHPLVSRAEFIYNAALGVYDCQGRAWDNGGATFDVDRQRNAIFTGNTTNALTKTGGKTADQTQVTFFGIFKWIAGTNNYPQLCGFSSANTSFRISSANQVGGDIGLVKGGRVALSTIPLTSNIWYAIVCSHDQASGDYYLILRDISSNTYTEVAGNNTQASSAGDGTYVIGNSRTAFAGAWNGKIALIGGGFYYVPKNIGNEFLKNPWQIFRSKNRISYFDLGSGANVAIAGSSQSVSYGLVIPNSAIAQTGQQVSSNSGSIAASIQYLAQLTGLPSSAVAGSIAPALLAALGGRAANFSQGQLSTAISAAISGIDTASAQGTLTALQVIEKALSGQESAFSSGPIAAVLDLALSGSEITASFGTVAASLGVIQALTGLSSTASVGDIIAALNTAVIGIENTLAGGTVTPLTGIIAQLSGLESSLLEGSIATAVTRILSGQAAEIQNGSPIVGRTISVSGNEISSAENQVGVSIAIGQTGATAVLHNGVISVYNPDVTLGLIGSQSAIQYGLLSKEIQLALFGQELAISGGQLVSIVAALGLGQSINIEQGSASLSVDKSLSGLVTLSGNGTVVFTDNNLQLALNGQSILTSAGRIYIKGGALGSSSITILQV